MSRLRPHTLTARLFAVFAILSAIPVVVLGFILAGSFRGEALQRGLSEGRSEARLVAATAVQPLLDGRLLSRGLSTTETRRLQLLVAGSLGRSVLRLRLRDDAGRIVFSDDGAGDFAPPDGEARMAARGQAIVRLTRLNADALEAEATPSGTVGTLGPRAVEIYEPLRAGPRQRVVGVLELYLPYAPIDHEVSHLLGTLYRDLMVGLGGLYLVLFAITASVSSRLRRESSRNGFLASHDGLTGLPNRTAFQRGVERCVVEASRDGIPAAVAVLGLDRFRDINDSLGYANGDTVLRTLADRLVAAVGEGALVARLGGDEYGVILPFGEAAEPLLRRLRAMLGREVSVAGVTLAAQVSIGYALTLAGEGGPEALLQRANVAMYAAKDQHCGVMRYESSLERHDAAALSLVAELAHAIDDDQLVLHYQPQQELGGDGIVALEALVRWQHPVHGLLFPDRFLTQAEQTDVIDHLTRWVLRRALRDADALVDCRGVAPRVAVNVSARSVGGGGLADDVLAALAEERFDPDRLIIEVTETAILADPQRAIAELSRIAQAGVRVSLDDFGQGQTSLRHLSTLPLHELKIDREFVGDMDRDATHATIVRSMIELGHNLGLQVVAEGVETDQVREQLREAGSDLIQGYLLSRPLPREQIVAWLADRAPSPVRA